MGPDMSKLQISDSLPLMESAGFVYGTSGTELVEYHEAASEPIRKQEDLLDLITALLKFKSSLSTTVAAQCRFQSSP